MGYALAKEQQRFVTRLVKAGRFNNQSEVVREALRRMQRDETAYLTPPPLTPAQIEAVYAAEDAQADAVGRGAFQALRSAVPPRPPRSACQSVNPQVASREYANEC
jgi:putative addiction module CopG family antidote